jgi:predicted PurR-regulated permease PerM
MTDDEVAAASDPPDLEAERGPSPSTTEAAGSLQEEIAPPTDGLPQAYGGGLVTTCLATLTFLAVVYSLYFGRDLIMPLAMAGVLNLLLRPLTTWLNEYPRLPMPVAALLVILAAVAVISGIAYLISVPSGGLAARAPESLAIAKERLAFLAAPISYLQEALHNIENIGAAASAAPQMVVARGDALPGILLFGTASTLRDLFVTLLILYFMLASGDRMLRALIEVLPRFSDKRRAVEIAGEIQASIASYLLTIFLMNAAVGILVGIAMALCGMGHPTLWGAVAFLLNFVPIIGPLIGIAIFFVAGLVTLAWPFPAVAPAICYALIHFFEGEMFTPHLVARRFELNPVLVILSLLFWDAIWGIPGALLAVPLLAIIKIFADRVDSLKSLGHLIGA